MTRDEAWGELLRLYTQLQQVKAGSPAYERLVQQIRTLSDIVNQD